MPAESRQLSASNAHEGRLRRRRADRGRSDDAALRDKIGFFLLDCRIGQRRSRLPHTLASAP